LNVVMPADRRERERTEMRERIIEAARRLFVTEGYDRTTLRRIAEEIEYTPGAIYAYFKDKDAILYALHQQGFEELGWRMTEVVLGAANPREALDRVGRAYLAFARDNPEMYDLMFIAQATSRAMNDKEWPEGERTYGQLKALVAAALEGGWIAGGDIESVSFLLWSVAHGMASLEIRERCKVIPADALPRVMEGAYDVILARLSTGKTDETAASEPRPRPRRGAPEL
jgi:AcrR family transcriptional regulator